MSLHIVIVNYQTPSDLARCLSSLVKHYPTVPCRVDIVCNDMTDHDRIAVETFLTPERVNWRLIALVNKGYANACNHAVFTSSEDVYAFFNADVEFTYGVLDACHDGLMENDDWGVLGPRQVDRQGKVTHAGIFGTNDRPTLRGWKRQTDEYQEVRDDAVSVSGSAYFVRRRCWVQIGNCQIYQEWLKRRDFGSTGAFLPTPHYYEETWCSYHARAHDWKVVYWGVHTMIHQWHQASPVGGAADRLMPISKEMFQSACDLHGILHD